MSWRQECLELGRAQDHWESAAYGKRPSDLIGRYTLSSSWLAEKQRTAQPSRAEGDQPGKILPPIAAIRRVIVNACNNVYIALKELTNREVERIGCPPVAEAMKCPGTPPLPGGSSI